MEFSIAASTAGIPTFLAYLSLGVVLVALYMILYSLITPHNEFGLIKRNNAAAGIAFAGSLMGFVIPLSSAIANSVSLGDSAVWGVVALIVQILAYFLLRIPIDNLSHRIIQGQIAAGTWLGVGSLAAGVINAACMTY